jgi:hypothetical protein
MLQLGLILLTFTAPQSFSAIVSWLIGRGNAFFRIRTDESTVESAERQEFPVQE